MIAIYDEAEAERTRTEADLDMLRMVDRFGLFYCDKCGRGPFQYCHYVSPRPGVRLKYCRKCWEGSEL